MISLDIQWQDEQFVVHFPSSVFVLVRMTESISALLATWAWWRRAADNLDAMIRTSHRDSCLI